MDPRTGELWSEIKLAQLSATSEDAAAELRERLVMVEGTEQAIADLSVNVALGAQAKANTRAAAELENLMRERAAREWKRQR